MLDLSQIKIIHEDNHLIAVNKPGGWLVQGDQTGDTPLPEYVKQYIKIRYKKPGDVFLGVIHRLDRPASGVVVFARTSKALSRMNELFRERKITKTYYAVTAERPDPIEDTIKNYILKIPAQGKSKVYETIGRRTAKAKLGELHYKLRASIEKHHLLEIDLKTGRPHQIRAQLAHIGTPIVGDKKYGFRVPNPDATIHLHCRAMSFIHPVKKEPVRIVAEPPHNQFWNLFRDNF